MPQKLFPCSIWKGFGAPQVPSVIARTICLIMIASARLGSWVLEQPGSSILDYYPAWLHLMEYHFRVFGERAVQTLVCLSLLLHVNQKPTKLRQPARLPHQVWKVGWWMAAFGGPSPKRHWAYANSSSILKLNRPWQRVRSSIATVIRYENKVGKQCYKGTRALRATEILAPLKLFPM